MPKLALLTVIGGPIELAEFPLSKPAPGTAALKLRIPGICGFDLHIFRGELPLPCPYALGHEMVGGSTELGDGLTTDATGKPLAVGDRVVTPYFWPGGQCHACARGRSMGRTFSLDPSALVYGNKSIRGVMLYDPVTLAIGLTFLQHTSFPFARLMAEPFHLADINDAFASADAGLVPRGALVT